MVAVVVLTTYSTESEFCPHRLALSITSHSRFVNTVYYERCEVRDARCEITIYCRAFGNYKCFVACAALGNEHSVLYAYLCQLAVADVVAVVAQTVYSKYGTYEFRSFLIHAVNVEHHQQVVAEDVFLSLAGYSFAPHIADGQIDEEVVVGLSELQERLTPLDVLHNEGSVAPDAVRRTHIHRSIEFPSWPRVVLGRVAGAVKEYVVNATGEHQVEVGFHLRQRRTEMLCQPGECLAAGKGFSHHVGCRRGIFQH